MQSLNSVSFYCQQSNRLLIFMKFSPFLLLLLSNPVAFWIFLFYVFYPDFTRIYIILAPLNLNLEACDFEELYQ